MDYQLSTHGVDKLVSSIESGRLALPDFQRDFVWSPSQVVDLLDSVARGWPIGSLLLLSGPQPFVAKPVDSGPKLSSQVETFVLDGQQRLTALFHAISNSGDVRYFVDFRRLRAGVSDAIRWKDADEFVGEFSDLRVRARQGVALISDVFYAENFFKWHACTTSELAEVSPAFREKLLPGMRAGAYRVPAIQLEKDIELEALARIFETLNRTGVRLNSFDLMVAVLYPHGFRLRERWLSAQAEFPRLQAYRVDGLEILKLIALYERDQPSSPESARKVKGVRQGDVLAIPPASVTRQWERAIATYDRSLAYAETEFGVRGRHLVPSHALQLALAFLLSAKTRDHHAIARWYWSAIADQRYAQGANTQVISDIDTFEIASQAPLQPSPLSSGLPLLEPVKRNRILMRGVGGALVRLGAKDPLTGRLLNESADISDWYFRNDKPRVVEALFFDSSSVRHLKQIARRGGVFSLLPEALASQFWSPTGTIDLHERARCLTRAIESLRVPV